MSPPIHDKSYWQQRAIDAERALKNARGETDNWKSKANDYIKQTIELQAAKQQAEQALEDLKQDKFWELEARQTSEEKKQLRNEVKFLRQFKMFFDIHGDSVAKTEYRGWNMTLPASDEFRRLFELSKQHPEITIVDGGLSTVKQLQAAKETAEQKARELRDKLLTYGNHKYQCAWHHGGFCNCNWPTIQEAEMALLSTQPKNHKESD